MVANWLYGVARQTALKARATAARRKARERQVSEMPEPAGTEQGFWRDLQPVLDDELSRLPDKYRVAIVLCDLEGKTRKEAARQLGLPEGTLSGRLTRARAMLAKRLSRHGMAVGAGALAAGLSQQAASAGVPTSVVSSAIKAATLFTAGQGAAAGVLSAKVVALTKGVLKAMLLNKLKGMAVGLTLVVAALVGGSGSLLPTHAGEKGAELTIPLKTEYKKKSGDEDFNKTILALEARFWEANMTSDTGALEQIYADDYVCFSERGRSDKPANIAAKKQLRTGKVQFRDVGIVRLNKDAAVVTYRADRTVLSRDGTFLFERRNCRISNTWVRRDGRWVLVFCQETQLPTVDQERSASPRPFFRPRG
jgi:hypothetical protein